MMKFLISLIIVPAIIVAAWATSPQKAERQRVREGVARMLAAHPQCTLQDIYKSCFQDAFGPGHLISDSAAVWRYLQSEMAENDHVDTVMTEPTGIDGNYVRVNLQLVNRGEISEGALVEALIASANSATPPTQEEWRSRWREIVSEISLMNLALPNFEADSIMIEEFLSEGRFVLHHSDLYGKTYHPHYRIIERNLFETLKNQPQNLQDGNIYIKKGGGT